VSEKRYRSNMISATNTYRYNAVISLNLPKQNQDPKKYCEKQKFGKKYAGITFHSTI